MRMLELEQIPWSNLEEKDRVVFCRADFNVPIKDGKVIDDYRIRQTIPTIKMLLDLKCVVILGAHLGRPQKKNKSEWAKLSLLPIGERLAELLGLEVMFSEEQVGSGVRKLILDSRPAKNVILLENLRFEPGEEKNDKGFAEKLLGTAKVYINDAFGASHRAHASIDAIAQFTQYRAMGKLLAKEWKVLNEIFKKPLAPQMAILGGAKIQDKIQVIERLLETCEAIFVGGRMGLTFLAAKGYKLGSTSIDDEAVQVAKRLLAEAKRQKVEVFLPIDGRAAEKIDATEAKVVEISDDHPVKSSLSIFDLGPKTMESWKTKLDQAKTVVWNGPMGVFENPAFCNGTLEVVRYLVDRSPELRVVCGGGETVAAVTRENALEKLYHVSTGGGAMLEFLEGKDLPGFEALKLKNREIDQLLAAS